MKIKYFIFICMAITYSSCKCYSLKTIGKISTDYCQLDINVISAKDSSKVSDVYVALIGQGKLNMGEEGFTNEKGEVVFGKFKEGVYNLLFIKKGYKKRQLRKIRFSHQSYTTLSLTLEEDIKE